MRIHMVLSMSIFLLFGHAFAESTQRITRQQAVKIALEAIKMTPNDISLRSKLDVDSFRLSIVDIAMHKPASIPDILDSAVSRIRLGTGAQIIADAAPLLDLTPINPVFNELKLESDWKDKTEIPPPLRKALDLLFGSFAAAEISLKQAFSTLDSFQIDSILNKAPSFLMPGTEKLAGEVDEATLEEEDFRELEAEKSDRRFFTLASRVKKQKLLEAAQQIAQACFATKDIIMTVPPQSGNASPPDTIAFGDIIYYAETKYGPIIIGGEEPTVYLAPCAIIIDLGGNDEYRGGAGGTDTTLKFSVAIDVSGDDIYWSDNSFSIGAAIGGVGILIDLAGADIYKCIHHNIGVGTFGWGLLCDYSGDDVYIGHTFTQGAGFCGAGIVFDSTGNDRYEAHLYAQAFGFVGGLGLVLDANGNDSYVCTGASVDKIRYADHHTTLCQGFGYGYRPDCSGGVGLLIEKAGNDSYISDIFGQGSSYWLALGAIYDIAGNDVYSSYQYAQGSGVHLSAAALIDLSGNDSYCSHGVSQGCGHDLGVGFLNDRDGDDNYVIWDLSQGAGNANGIGFLVDEGNGEDSYTAKREYNVQGYGNWRRDFGSIGVMLDLGGKDTYTGKGTDGTWWSHSNYGIGIDFPGGIPEKTK